jgi:hypothetical protein
MNLLRSSRAISALLLLCSFAPLPLWAQNPSTQPAPAPRRTVIIPSGFKLVVDGRRSAICQEGDEAWVRQALADRTPTTKPTTMPATLLERVSAQRDELANRMTADLALTDTAAARKMIDEELIPLLRRADEFNPPIFYLITSDTGLRQLVRDGWSDPEGRYRYNRAADRVSIDNRLTLALQGDVDDQVLAVLYEPTDDLTTRRERLVSELRVVESQLAYEVSTRAMVAAQFQFVQFVQTTVESLKLPREQQWFGVGIMGVLSARYLAFVNDVSPDTFLKSMTSEDRRNPVRMATVDLMNPADLNELREIARPAYATAVQRKSTAVVKLWLDRAGPEALPKVLRAMRAAPPQGAEGLVRLIATESGIDLTSELKPG